jgi:hypothetical protein
MFECELVDPTLRNGQSGKSNLDPNLYIRHHWPEIIS